MSKQTINVGARANDGSGDSIRTAFIKTNNNFTEIFNTAQAAFDAANTYNNVDVVFTQAAYNKANTSANSAQLAYNKANAAYDFANTIISSTGVSNEGHVSITAGSTEHWIATQRRDKNDSNGKGLRYDSQGNLYTVVMSWTGNEEDGLAVVTKYTTAGAVTWQKTIPGAYPMSLSVDSADRAYIAVDSNSTGLNLFKFDTDGTILWKKSYNTANTGIYDAFIEEKNSSSIIVACNSETDGPNRAIVFNINSSTGAVAAQKEISQNAQSVYVSGIDIAPDETVYVSGKYYNVDDDKNKMYITKLSTNLTQVWTKSLESPDTYDMTGGDCASDALGNIYAVGYYNVNVINFNSNTSETAGIITKLNSSGVTQWTRRIGPGPCGIAVAGLTATATGDVYLATSTFEYKRDQTLSEANQNFMGVNKLVVAKYNTSGDVIWQRYVDSNYMWEYTEDFRGQAVAVYDNKFAVDGYGWSVDTTAFEWSGSDDDEQDYFVVQLPTDGTELTLGKFEFTESRIPGRWITQETTTANTIVHQTFSETVTVADSTLTPDDEARIANEIIQSETYEYVFGADGTLTIPNDGDVRLTQSQVGYLYALGGAFNTDYNIYGRSIATDSQGNTYVVGEDEDTYQPFVTKIDPEGFKVWGVVIEDDIAGNNGRSNGIAIHPTTGNVVVTIELYGSYTYGETVTLDQDTGRILSSEKFSNDVSNVYLVDIDYNAAGTDYAYVGSKDGNFSPEYTVVPQTGSANGVIYVLRSAIDSVKGTTAWQINGTGFSDYENISSINYYPGTTGTVRQGSGATFSVTDIGDGSYSAAILNGGTNYRIGHQIKILGSLIGGANTTNDAIITVDGWNQTGVITGISVSGTAAGTESALYSGLSGTNYNVGSGFALDLSVGSSNTYAYYDSWSYSNQGTNYAEGDVITVDGANLGGVSSNNDMTIVVNSVSDGTVTGISLSGTAQTTKWKIITSTQAEFGSAGSWTVKYPLSRENYLVTDNWSRVFGTNTGNETDRLYAVSIDTSGNIITVGEGYGEVTGGEDYVMPMVYKFNSAGTLQWAKRLNDTDYDGRAMSVATIGTDIYVTHYSVGPGSTIITKLSADGTVKWQRETDSTDDSVIVNAGDGNILVAVEGYNADIDAGAIKIFKMTPSGETVFKRWLYGTTDGNTNFKNGRGLAVDSDNFYITAYFYANGNNSSIVAKLPIDGTGIGEYGTFRYAGVDAMTDSYDWPGITGTNYDIIEVVLEETFIASVTPYANNTSNVAVSDSTGDLYVGNFDPNKTVEVVRDTDGGRIVFADGTTQNTTATDIPQRITNGQRYTLGLKDRGHHIYCVGADDSILIPYNSRVEFPIGTVITIVNNSGTSIFINKEGATGGLFVAGNGEYSSCTLDNLGMATLLKVATETWFVSGHVTSN